MHWAGRRVCLGGLWAMARGQLGPTKHKGKELGPTAPLPASLPKSTRGPWIPVGALFGYLSTRDTSPKAAWAPSNLTAQSHNSRGSSALRKNQTRSSVSNCFFLSHFPSHTAYLKPRLSTVLLRPI